jgi:adenylate kinase
MNILIFGPNGSGKGTQGAIVQKKYNIKHVESGVIFRCNIKNQTELGSKASEFIDHGNLVPDNITIPMILDRIKEEDCHNGWLLDGFPRNKVQAIALEKALNESGIELDYIIEIILDRETAKKRIMGRRICEIDGNHPNNIFIDAIKPAEKNGTEVCRVCGGALTARSDDQDESAINKRHDIYYDNTTGTLSAVNYFKNTSGTSGKKNPKIIELDSKADVTTVSENLIKMLQ